MDEKEAKHIDFYLMIVQDMIGTGFDEKRRTGLELLGGPKTQASWQRKLTARYLMAQDILSRLDEMRPPAMPERPATLPADDISIYLSKCTVQRKRERAPSSDVEIVEEFLTWSTEVSRLESESKGILQLLLSVHDSLCAVRDSGFGNHSEIAALEQHIERHWFCELPLPVEPVTRRRFIDKASRNKDLLVTWLLEGERPPKFVPRSSVKDFDPRGSQGFSSDDFKDEYVDEDGLVHR